MSDFNPDTFLDSAITEVIEALPPLPAGGVYTATIGEIKARQWTGKEDPSKSGVALDVPLVLDTSMVPGYLPKVTIKDSVMLDFKEGTQTIDTAPGKNSKLRSYKEALDMNKPGDAFAPRMMQGRLVKVKIKHREYQGQIFNDVAAIARA